MYEHHNVVHHDVVIILMPIFEMYAKSILREIFIFRRIRSFTTGFLSRRAFPSPVPLARPYIAAFVILCVSNSNFLFRPPPLLSLSRPLVPRPRAIHYSYQHPDRSTFCPCLAPAVGVGRLRAVRPYSTCTRKSSAGYREKSAYRAACIFWMTVTQFMHLLYDEEKKKRRITSLMRRFTRTCKFFDFRDIFVSVGRSTDGALRLDRYIISWRVSLVE